MGTKEDEVSAWCLDSLFFGWNKRQSSDLLLGTLQAYCILPHFESWFLIQRSFRTLQWFQKLSCLSLRTTERPQSFRAARQQHSTRIIQEAHNLLTSAEFDLAGLRIILQRLEKSIDELTKANEALHAQITDDEMVADNDSVLEYEDWATGCVGVLWHHIHQPSATEKKW